MTARAKPRAIDTILDAHDVLDELLATRSKYVGRAGQAEWRQRWNQAMESAHGQRNALPVPDDSTASSSKLTWMGGDVVMSAEGPFGDKVTVVAAVSGAPARWTLADRNGQVVTQGSSTTTSAAITAATSACPGATP